MSNHSNQTTEGKAVPIEVIRENPFAISGAKTAPQGMLQVAASRHAQEVQAAMAIAKRFPRNEEASFNRIMQACKRKSLAEEATYAYPRGDTTVTGPSIDLARAAAQSWGNLDYGIVELEQKDGESTVMSFCWDLETNTRETRVFTVPHERHTKKGITKLTDPRDIYETIANVGARRLRACILGILPRDVIEAAVEECDKTLQGGSKEPLIDRVRRMTQAFDEEFKVNVPMLEKRLGHRLDATSEQELVALRKIFKALRDNMGKREDYFEHLDKVESADMVTTGSHGSAGQTQQTASTSPVPNEVLGAKKTKEKKTTKPTDTAQESAAEQQPEPSPRLTALNHFRKLMALAGIEEADVLANLAARNILLEGTRLESLGVDLLASFIGDWENIATAVNAKGAKQ